MAVSPLIPRPPAPAGSVSPRAEQVRAAQRAFFDTALAGEMAAATPARAPTTAVAAPPAVAREVRVAIDPEASAPARPLRPGSLLDIKV